MPFRLKAALGAGLLLASASAASAATATAVSAVNVRSGPGGSYRVIDTLPAGETVNILGCADGWCEISMGADGTGFASESFLDVGRGRPLRERVVVERDERYVTGGLSVGGYWGDNPYYYDDGHYYYGGRWYDERPGRPGWERSWRRDDRRGDGPRRDRDANRGDRDFGNGGDRDPGRDRPSRVDIDRGAGNRDRRNPGATGSGAPAQRPERIDTPRAEAPRIEREAPRVERSGPTPSAPAPQAPADRGDRVGLDRAR